MSTTNLLTVIYLINTRITMVNKSEKNKTLTFRTHFSNSRNIYYACLIFKMANNAKMQTK